MASLHPSLEAAIADEQFPEVDLMLRRGRHIGRDDGLIYDYLLEMQAALEEFYRRFGCELVQQSDGYFYLLPSGDRLGRRLLTAGEMIVGQALALLYLDPASLQHSSVVEPEIVLQRLSGLLGVESLIRTLNPRKRSRKLDERIAAEMVRTQVTEALRRLESLGFVEIIDEGRLKLRPALMRFTEPIRGLANQGTALERLIGRGEVQLGEGEEEGAHEDEASSSESDP